MPEPAPLPPPPSAPGRWGRRIDVVSVGLVLAFAFVAASFVARNSDLWLHLATGRLLAHGEYRFGADPFAYTTAGTYWSNHAWLFDLGLYLAHDWFGGPALVVLKAAAVTAAAGLILLVARGRGPVWVAVACVLPAVLAMSPRLLLQPTIASLVLLAGCLYCLRTGGRALRAVPVLIAAWVNVDAWFVLGPALVALFWLGRRIDPERESLPPWPVWLLPAAVGACLLSPHHVFAFRLPMELSPAVWTSAFASDPRFAGVFAHPWHRAPLGAAGGYGPAAWAFFVLLTLGVVSFVMNRRAVRSWRFVVWLPFAALGAWQTRLIPFFALVAGPIAALNLREVVPEGAFPRPGRLLAVAGALVLIALGWLGWLGGVNARDRGFGWGVHTDPTLARAAEGVATWRHTNGVPAEARVFTTHPDVGHYLAWHAPGERYFLDSRLSLFAGVADEFAALSRAVGVLPDGGGPLPPDVAAVVLYDPDARRTSGPLGDVARGRWDVLRIDGGAVLLAPRGAPTVGPRFDPERAAFAGATDLPVAREGPSRLAEPAPWWRVRGGRGRIGSWAADAAAVYRRLGDAAASHSPALRLLAVRAARAGTEVDPDDPAAWMELALAYLPLAEREAQAGLTPLEHIRFVQVIGALTQAVLLNPDSGPAHETLARVFRRRNSLDLAHRHAAAAARLVRRAGRGAEESAEAFAARTAQADALADELLESVQDAQNRYLIRGTGLTGQPFALARIATDLGLTQKAIDVLLASRPELYGAPGLGLLADLLLRTGQVAECRTLLDREELRHNPGVLGYYELPRRPNPDGSRWPYRLSAYEWLNLCQHAAAGRYTGAREAVDRLCEVLAGEEQEKIPALDLNAALLLGGDVGLAVPPNPVLNRMLGVKQRATLEGLTVYTRGLSVTRADLMTVAGALDLERGDPRAAAARFEAARAIYAAAPGFAVARPGEPLAVRYDNAIRAAR